MDAYRYCCPVFSDLAFLVYAHYRGVVPDNIFAGTDVLYWLYFSSVAAVLLILMVLAAIYLTWQQAVQASLVRHRNLLVISPWSLFPAGGAADFRYAELLPLLRHADACAFNKTVSIAHWNLKEFKCFHQRARAVLQQRSATTPIAKHV